MQAKYLLLLRAVVIEVLLLHALYAPQGLAWSRGSVWALLGLYAFCAAALHWLARRRPSARRWLPASFLLDIGLTTAALYAIGDVGSDLYIAYFLVILSSCLQENLSYSLIVGLVSCVVYGALAFPGSNWLEEPFYLLHTSLLLITAFFGAYAAATAKRVESELEERFEQKVAWMQRLSWVGQALSAVLHEVRTPLNTVMLSVEYSRRCLERGQAKEASEQLAVIEREAERAVAVVSNYLEFAKPSELSLSPLAVQKPLGKALEAIAVWLDDRDIALDASLGEDAPVAASERHLVQVFTNLLMNAVEAMPLGGRLEVGVERDGPLVRVVIRDTGVGVAPEMARKLFKPFATSKDDYEGHGLGLSIARWIVHKHRGRIALESGGVNRGARVVVELPVLT